MSKRNQFSIPSVAVVISEGVWFKTLGRKHLSDCKVLDRIDPIRVVDSKTHRGLVTENGGLRVYEQDTRWCHFCWTRLNHVIQTEGV